MISMTRPSTTSVLSLNHDLGLVQALTPCVDQLVETEYALTETMRQLGHGRIEHLLVRDGIPVVGKDTKMLQYFRGERDPTSLTSLDTKRIRRPHRLHQMLFGKTRQMQAGVLERVEVADGLPVYWTPR